MNEQVLRFLNLRFPRDYDTVPRAWFWLLHLVWLFPWSVYFPAVAKLSFKPVDRAGKTRLLALCWTGFLLVFFSFSTTQEYYSMPCYPALALLLGSAMAAGGNWVRWGTRVLSVILALAAIACFALLFVVRGLPSPGDISTALVQNPAAYKLSMGHIGDLTIPSFAYLRVPLFVAGVAFLVGAVGTVKATGQRAFLAAAFMAVSVFARGSTGAGGVRSLYVVAAAGAGFVAGAGGAVGDRSSLLHVLVHLFLYEPDCTLAEWADEQFDLRVVCAGCS